MHTRCRQPLLQTSSSHKLLHLETTPVAWVSAYKFCAQQLHQVHTGHIVCQNVPIKHFLYKSSSPEPKVVQKNLIQFWKAKEVLYFVCDRHLLGAYTFAVAASRLLSYKKLKF
jgi:hypothetical protein